MGGRVYRFAVPFPFGGIMKTLSIDIETYSSENLAKSGVYRYAESSDFEVLLFGYSADGAPVKVVDLTAGETIPDDVRSALTDPTVTKWAFNAQFERVSLSRYLGYPTGKYLNPSSWHCTMVWVATLGLPLSLEGVGAVLGLEKQKLKEGKTVRLFDIIRQMRRRNGRFSKPTTCVMWKRKCLFSRNSPSSRSRNPSGATTPSISR